ncbi:PaaI family thioesterase [Leifsonia sp. ZF2019]|uniref:PaaI family thioesterase n=1 Tax=Leifsonia sp. ZF2019 TaxID=2781978 RepID=UPI001CBB5DE5|nr:PaaI family thioesterase [Leifsonia sp. ZF2019]UAJ79499.1 PaaI family thioesterase [Leifsonia sp. ZF2019]
MTRDCDGDLPVLAFLQRAIDGTLSPDDTTHLTYPTPISRLLGFELVGVSERAAEVRFVADVSRHGNQQGTLHGGMLCELADAAMGTAHSTAIVAGESFTSLDLDARFLRPVWSGPLIARARCTHAGRTISHYACDVLREDGKPVASFTSAILTLRGDAATGR